MVNDPPIPDSRTRRRGLESVVKLHISRPRSSSVLPPEGNETLLDRARSRDSTLSGPEPGKAEERASEGSRLEADEKVRSQDERSDDIHQNGRRDNPTSLDAEDERPYRLGDEGSHARAGFREEALIADEPIAVSEEAAIALSSHASSSEIEIVLDGDRSPDPEQTNVASLSGGSEIPSPVAPQSLASAAEKDELLSKPASVAPAPAPPAPSSGLSTAVESGEAPAPSCSSRVVLTLAAASSGLRRVLSEALAQPLTQQGRCVLLVESEPPDADGLFEQALGLDVLLSRRWLGAATRDILLMPAVDRRSLFSRLAREEQRSEMIVMDLGLPESVFCSRLQFFVDEIVVAITPRDSSLYEAYRALRGLQEKRPGLAPFVVSFAKDREDAQDLFERFETIARDFLNLPVTAGGWIELPIAHPSEPKHPLSASPGLSDSLERALVEGPSRSTVRHGSLREAGRPFFDHLSEWFGPIMP